jgi:hypothetical protein
MYGVYVYYVEGATPPVESCIQCQHPTSFWWADGCMPLCVPCSKRVSHEDMCRVAASEGFGPLPDENTNRKNRIKRPVWALDLEHREAI